MGFLTTITFHNDAADEIEKHPKQVAKIVSDAQSRRQIDQGRDYDPVGNHCNPVVIQKPRHADDHTLYLHAGNTVIDVCDVESDWGIDQFIHEMEYHLKRLKEIRRKKVIDD